MTMYQFDDETSRTDGTAIALAAMRRGDVIGLNADSSYALATDAFSPRGLKTIRSLKGRADLITPILIGRVINLEGILTKVTPEMHLLMEAFWPGPLTFLATPQPSLAWEATRDAISVRMPSNEWTRELAYELGPMVAVAASRGSHAAPTTATQGSEIWGSDVPIWLNSGAAHSDLQSTVIDVRSDRPNIVRLGSLTASTLRGVVPGITMIAN
jgi:L-threonylcarbamoyladenylate synthase